MPKRTLTYTPDMGVTQHQMGLVDDFLWYVTAHLWTTVATDSGSVAHGDAACGVITLTPSDGTVTDNDEAYIKSTCEVFKIAAGRVIEGECLLKFTEGATDDVNVGFFFQNAIGANSILDDGAGLKVSGDTFGIYKVDGGLVWRCVSCVNGVSTVSVSGKLSTSSSYQRLGIRIADVDGSTCEVHFLADGQPLLDGTTRRPIVHTVAIASATEMQVGAGVKNGADTTAEALLIDYLGAWQTR